jgi:hypothetical protein
LQEAIEILVWNDAHQQHVKVVQLFGVRSLQIRKVLMLTLNFTYLLAVVNGNKISQGIPRYDYPVGNLVGAIKKISAVRIVLRVHITKNTLG